MICNHVQIWGFCKVLVMVSFATSKRRLDIYYTLNTSHNLPHEKLNDLRLMIFMILPPGNFAGGGATVPKQEKKKKKKKKDL